MAAEVGQLAAPHQPERLVRRAAAEHAPPRGQLVEEHAEAEDVAAPVEALPARLLRGHVGVLAAEDLRVLAPPEAGLVGPRDAEVGDLHLALVAKQDVLRAHVPVHDLQWLAVVALRAVRVVEGLGDLRPDPEAQAEAQRRLARPAEAQRGREVPAPQVLHGDEVAALLFAEVEDLDDVGVAQPRGDLGLSHQELREARPLEQGREHPLDDDRLLEAGDAARARPPHLGHASLGDALEEVVRTEGDRGRHGARV